MGSEMCIRDRVKPVDELIESFADAGANLISFHPEASNHVHRSIQKIKNKNCQAGLVLNPASPLNLVEDLLDEIDLVLLMSVNPGFGGQKFIQKTLSKIKKLKKIIDKKGLNVRIEVDGGVNLENIGEISSCGADTFVMGSAIFNSKSYDQTISKAHTLIS